VHFLAVNIYPETREVFSVNGKELFPFEVLWGRFWVDSKQADCVNLREDHAKYWQLHWHKKLLGRNNESEEYSNNVVLIIRLNATYRSSTIVFYCTLQ
jgi:hypothetical protein